MWFYVPWPQIIRDNRENSLGVKFAHKLSFLEGFGALLGLVMAHDKARNSQIELMNDNAGFVYVYKRKHSSCPYTYTVAKAIHDVGIGLNCKVNTQISFNNYLISLLKVSVTKTKRCSSEGELVADALSKGDWQKAKFYMPDKRVDPEFIPRVLLKWIRNPLPDMRLGEKVLSEMSSYSKVLHAD